MLPDQQVNKQILYGALSIEEFKKEKDLHKSRPKISSNVQTLNLLVEIIEGRNSSYVTNVEIVDTPNATKGKTRKCYSWTEFEHILLAKMVPQFKIIYFDRG